MNNKKDILKIMNEQNKPYKKAVTINCSHIGDDNDYSCFLYNVITILFKQDTKLAYKMFLTDPMLINYDMSLEEFTKHMNDRIERDKKFDEEDKKREQNYNKYYRD
jgi:hypothetical protein